MLAKEDALGEVMACVVFLLVFWVFVDLANEIMLRFLVSRGSFHPDPLGHVTQYGKKPVV